MRRWRIVAYLCAHCCVSVLGGFKLAFVTDQSSLRARGRQPQGRVRVGSEGDAAGERRRLSVGVYRNIRAEGCKILRLESLRIRHWYCSK